jgi:hypothetical protein
MESQAAELQGGYVTPLPCSPYRWPKTPVVDDGLLDLWGFLNWGTRKNQWFPSEKMAFGWFWDLSF